MRQEPLWNTPWWMTLVILPALLAVLLRRRWELV